MYVWQSIPILLLSSITGKPAIYLGFMLSVICSKNAITAGASVMIFGVLGAYIAYLIINWATL